MSQTALKVNAERAAKEGYEITLLDSQQGKVGKGIRKNETTGELETFERDTPPTWYGVRQVPFEDLDGLYRILRTNAESNETIAIYGVPHVGTDMASTRRKNKHFAHGKSVAIIMDCDNAECGTLDVRKCGEAIRANLPPIFRNAKAIAYATGSHSFKGDRARIRMVFLASRPLTVFEISALLDGYHSKHGTIQTPINLKIDHCIYAQTQPIYFNTDVPKWLDPVKERWAKLDGEPVVVVPDHIELPKRATSKAANRERSATRPVIDNELPFVHKFLRTLRGRNTERVVKDGRRNSLRMAAQDAWDFAITEDLANAMLWAWFNGADEDDTELSDTLTGYKIGEKDIAEITGKLQEMHVAVGAAWEGDELTREDLDAQVSWVYCRDGNDTPYGGRCLSFEAVEDEIDPDPLSLNDAVDNVVALAEYMSALQLAERDERFLSNVRRYADEFIIACDADDDALSEDETPALAAARAGLAEAANKAMPLLSAAEANRIIRLAENYARKGDPEDADKARKIIEKKLAKAELRVRDLKKVGDRIREAVMLDATDLDANCRLIAKVLRERLPIYSRNRRLAQITTVDLPQLPPLPGETRSNIANKIMAFEQLEPVQVEAMIAENVDCRRHEVSPNGTIVEKSARPPTKEAQFLVKTPETYGIPAASQIATAPFLLANGEIVSTPGYHEDTRVVLTGDVTLPADLPVSPTRDEALASLARLNDLLSEFPFVDEASRSVALSMILSLLTRNLLDVVPLHVVSAPTAGTGKSELASIPTRIVLGTELPVMAAGRDEAETEKRLVGAVLGGHPVTCLDNVNGPLFGDFLCQLLSQTIVVPRELGKSKTPTIHNRSTIFATGNNTVIPADMVRRTLMVRLDAKHERPALRTFQRTSAQMKAYIAMNRGRLVADGLIIVKAFLRALERGEARTLPPLANYEAWSAWVRSPLVWLACADPVKTQDGLAAEDPIARKREIVFRAWHTLTEGEPAKTSDVMGSGGAFGPVDDEDDPLGTGAERMEALDAIKTEIVPANGKRTAQDHALALGRYFAQQRGTVAAGLTLEGVKGKGGFMRWQTKAAQA